jgi:hypothetical protein
MRGDLAGNFHSAVAFIDDANVNGKPFPANNCSWCCFDKLYAHHFLQFLSSFEKKQFAIARMRVLANL